jgi:hypothetical protein
LPSIDTPYFISGRWRSVNDDAPGWEDAWDIIDLSDVNDDEDVSNSFYDDFNRYRGTKVGGYPMEIQHGVGIQNFVFQVGSEEKVNWMWADNGIGYFHKSPEGAGRFRVSFTRDSTSVPRPVPKLTKANVAWVLARLPATGQNV